MRYPIEYIEILRDTCSRTFGNSPCNATGIPCFNTFSTCQYMNAFNATQKKDIFISSKNSGANIYSQINNNESIYPLLVSVKHTPPTINPLSASSGATALGTRASISITLNDGGSDDRFQDKYFFQREDPNENGTFFTKYFARNKYLINRQINWITAEVKNGQIVNKKTKSYIITEIAGVDSNGKITLNCQDVLVLTNSANAEYPAISAVTLLGDIDENQTTISTRPQLGIDGFVNDSIELWATSGYARIDDEIVRYTSRSGNTLTVQRGVLGTSKSSHSASTTVQRVADIVRMRPYKIVEKILKEATNIPHEMLNLQQWERISLAKEWMIQEYTAYISKPTAVFELLADIAQQMMFFPYFDEETNKILLSATDPNISLEATSKSLNDNEHFLEDSFKVKRNDKETITRLNNYIGVLNWAEDLKDPTNYKSRILLLTGEESKDRRRFGKSMDLMGYFLTDNQADFIGRQILKQLGETPTTYSFSLDIKDSDIRLTSFVKLSNRLLVDAFGFKSDRNAQITKVSEVANNKLEVTAINYAYYPMPDFDGNYFISIPISTNNVNLRALFDQERPGVQIPSGATITFDIASGVLIGSMDTNIPALQTGNWNSGVNIVLKCGSDVRIYGRGGDGGMGGGLSTRKGTGGKKGGDAFFIDTPTIIVGRPILGGGGGGGGGGHRYYDDRSTAVLGGGGGGGGGGHLTGNGGNITTVNYNGVLGKVGKDGSITNGGNGGNGGGKKFGGGAWRYAGNGGNGGGLGQNGQNGQSGNDGVKSLGGLAGRAVVGNSLLTAPNAIFIGARV